MAKQVEANSIDPLDIETDLYQTFLNAKHDAASKAAEASTVEENASHCAEAKSLLTMTEQFLGLPGMFTPERFAKLYEKSLYWIAFRVNAADGELRDAERSLLFDLVNRASDDDAPAMLEALKPMDPWAFGPEDAQSMLLKNELRSDCVTRLLPKVEESFTRYLERPEGLRLLSTPQGSASFRYVLFSKDRLPWPTVVRSALFKTLGNAKNDDNAYDKANDFLELVMEAAENRSPYIARESAVAIAADQEFVTALWQAVTSRHIQYRMLRSYLSKREALLRLGVHEENLPLSVELAKAKESGEPEETAAEDHLAEEPTGDFDLSFLDEDEQADDAQED
jgi:hypothetical protein